MCPSPSPPASDSDRGGELRRISRSAAFVPEEEGEAEGEEEGEEEGGEEGEEKGEGKGGEEGGEEGEEDLY